MNVEIFATFLQEAAPTFGENGDRPGRYMTRASTLFPIGTFHINLW
jgi:hypothetical protein